MQTFKTVLSVVICGTPVLPCLGVGELTDSPEHPRDEEDSAQSQYFAKQAAAGRAEHHGDIGGEGAHPVGPQRWVLGTMSAT